MNHNIGQPCPVCIFTAARHTETGRGGRDSKQSGFRETEQRTNLEIKQALCPPAPPSDSVQNRDNHINIWG